MADDYTPTLSRIKFAWEEWRQMIQNSTKYPDELQDEFDRALAAHDAEVRAAALAEQGETEWEFSWSGTDDEGDEWVMDDTFDTRESAEAYTRRPIGGWVLTDHGELVRRRKAGPWMPVEQGKTTKTEATDREVRAPEGS